MAVYVDPNLAWPKTDKWKYGSVAHLYADTEKELHEFAQAIGLHRKWCSDHTQPHSLLLHYDLSPGKRAEAVKNGAVEVDHAHALPYEIVRSPFFRVFVEDYTEDHAGDEDFRSPRARNYKRWAAEWKWFARGLLTWRNHHASLEARRPKADPARNVNKGAAETRTAAK